MAGFNRARLSIVCPADNANAQRGLNSHGPFANGPYEKQSPVVGAVREPPVPAVREPPVRVVAVTSPWTACPAFQVRLEVCASLSANGGGATPGVDGS